MNVNVDVNVNVVNVVNEKQKFDFVTPNLDWWTDFSFSINNNTAQATHKPIKMVLSLTLMC